MRDFSDLNEPMLVFEGGCPLPTPTSRPPSKTSVQVAFCPTYPNAGDIGKVTDLVPSETACLASSLVDEEVWILRDGMAGFLE